MNPSHFDVIARRFAERRLSRRRALIGAGAGFAATGMAATGMAAGPSDLARAQDATPAGATPVANAGDSYPKMLFVQSYQSGSIAPSEGTEGQYTITLTQGLGQTIFFTDRPDRKVGATPTGDFLKGMGFAPDNPPNAALIVETSEGASDLVVLELFSPTYDEASRTATYEATVLADWEETLDLGFSKAPADLASFTPVFGAANLFIDDCADGTVTCTTGDTHYPCASPGGLCGSFGPMGYCYNWSSPGCWPCEPYDHLNPPPLKAYEYWIDRCNNTFASCYLDGRQDSGCTANL